MRARARVVEIETVYATQAEILACTLAKIREDELYAFTHPEMSAKVKERFAAYGGDGRSGSSLAPWSARSTGFQK
jgi:hypothetical protein